MSTTPNSACRFYRRAIIDLIDGVDSVESRQRLTAHAEGCERCAVELARATELRRLIDSAEEPEISADSEAAFIDQVMAGIEDQPAVPVMPSRRLRVAFAVAAAAGILFMLWPRSEPAPGVSPQVESIAAVETVPVAESVAEPNTTTKTASAQLHLGESSAPIAQADFEGLLAAASNACTFDPQVDLESDDWMAALTLVAQAQDSTQSTMLRSARRVLREEASSPSAPLAARILGRRADLRDRRLLTNTLAATGTAGALALCERGDVGVKLLWKAAASTDEGADGSEVQRNIERALIQWNAAGHAPLTESLDLSLNVPLAATLLAQSGPDAAGQLLAQYLEQGDARWREAWLAAPMHEQALADAFQRLPRRADSARTERMLIAMEHAAFGPGLDFAIEALIEGHAAAAGTLAALPGEEPLLALMGAARAGRLQPSSEDLAWGILAERRSEAVVAFASAAGGHAAERTAFTLTHLALVVDSHPAARRTLLRLGLSAELLSEHRVRALLLAVEGTLPPTDSLMDADLASELLELTEAPESELAAAAWMVLWHLKHEAALTEHPLGAALHSTLRSTLARPGTLAVQHLRVAREIRRARAGTRSL